MRAVIFVMLMAIAGGAETQTPSQAMCLKNGQWLIGACESQGSVSDGLPPSYRLITQTYGGRVDIRKGLTQEQCEHDRLKALNQPADEEERKYAERFTEEDAADASQRKPQECDSEPLAGATIMCQLKSIASYMRSYQITSSNIRRAICEKQP